MALDGQVEILGAHPGAIVDDADQPLAARLNRDIDPGRARVERVFDEFFNGRGGPLDDLARGDAVDEDRVKAAHPHQLKALHVPVSALDGFGRKRPKPIRHLRFCRPAKAGCWAESGPGLETKRHGFFEQGTRIGADSAPSRKAILRPAGASSSFVPARAPPVRHAFASIVVPYPYCGLASTIHDKPWMHQVPVVVVTAGKDLIVSNKRILRFIETLAKNGTKVTHKHFENLGHGFDVEGNMTYRAEARRELEKDVLTYLAKVNSQG
jgi:hypothetical protein